MTDGHGLETLNAFIANATLAFRKGEAYEEKDVGGVKVITVNGYPEAPSRGALVDVHFLMIGFTEAAAIDKDEFVSMIKDAEHGEFMDMSLDDLAQGPSYINTGAWLGSQDLALRFIALGSHYGLWDVVTPALLHITGAQADQMAGAGFVMNAGLRR